MDAKRGFPLTKSDQIQKQFDAKLLAYCAAASGVLLAAPSADASVIYSGVKNFFLDSNLPGTVQVDLDNDGLNDFGFIKVKTARWGAIYLSPGTHNYAAVSSFYGNWMIRRFGGALISNNAIWSNDRHVLNGRGVYGSGGAFSRATGYMGIKFQKGNEMHYGWIQYSGGVLNTCRVSGHIIDWAYESTSNTPIKAGQMTDLISGDFKYTVADNQVTISGYTGTGGAVAIPATINGSPVVGIGSKAFIYKAAVTGITLPEGLISIGANAFQGCTGLTGVAIPGSVKSIGSGAFSGCSGLTGVTINSGIENIGAFAFTYCSSLNTVTIPATVTSIGQGAFAGCGKLRTALFNGNAPVMEDIVFDRCTSGFTVLYLTGATGFTNPWYTYPAAAFSDLDDDGIADAIDNCQGVYNPQQLDGNTNGSGDCCETAPGCGGCGQPACDTVCSK